MDSEAWSNMLRSRENMEEFAKEAIVFLRFHDFDGIDLDWQYPAFRKSTAEDKERFADFLEVREKNRYKQTDRRPDRQTAGQSNRRADRGQTDRQRIEKCTHIYLKSQYTCT